MTKLNAEELNNEILRAHDNCDSYALTELYIAAADMKHLAGDMDAAGFLRTQAFVFALESKHPLESEIRLALVADGRELSE